MAIQALYETPEGVRQESYYRISIMNQVENGFDVRIDIFNNRDERLDGRFSIGNIKMIIPVSIVQRADIDSMITQIYTYLKTLPEFAGAVDV